MGRERYLTLVFFYSYLDLGDDKEISNNPCKGKFF